MKLEKYWYRKLKGKKDTLKERGFFLVSEAFAFDKL